MRENFEMMNNVNKDEIKEALKKELLENWDIVEHLAPEYGIDSKKTGFEDEFKDVYTDIADKMGSHGPKNKIKATFEKIMEKRQANGKKNNVIDMTRGLEMERPNEINQELKKELIQNWDIVESMAPDFGFDPKEQGFEDDLLKIYIRTADKMGSHGPKNKIKSSLEILAQENSNDDAREVHAA
jgi:hypothetical protein